MYIQNGLSSRIMVEFLLLRMDMIVYMLKKQIRAAEIIESYILLGRVSSSVFDFFPFTLSTGFLLFHLYTENGLSSRILVGFLLLRMDMIV